MWARRSVEAGLEDDEVGSSWHSTRMWRGAAAGALDTAHDGTEGAGGGLRPSGAPTTVPPVPARVRVALVVLCAALLPAPAYGTTLAQSSPAAQAAQDDDNGQLSPTPPLEPSDENGDSNSSTPSSSAPSSAPLPDTGADLPTTALLALGLIVSGIGLRMRTVDERIF